VGSFPVVVRVQVRANIEDDQPPATRSVVGQNHCSERLSGWVAWTINGTYESLRSVPAWTPMR
jgi:hypothetical protein